MLTLLALVVDTLSRRDYPLVVRPAEVWFWPIVVGETGLVYQWAAVSPGDVALESVR